MAQAAQWQWSLLLGDLWKPPGGGPAHPAVSVPAWAGVGPYWDILSVAGHGKKHLRQAESIWELLQGYLGE